MTPMKIRRATVDDLPALKSLWRAALLPVDELENRLTEFQVVESGGIIAGAVGLQIIRQHARLHSEDYTDFSIADAARELFWERIQALAANHGVFRLWTQETSPFWTHWGFHPADAETLQRLPDEWKNLEGRPGAPERSKGGWLTLELKNEDAIKAALENRFNGFMNAEKKQTADVAAQARKLRTFFTVVFLAIGILFFAAAIYLFLHHPLARR
jgi:N-acetylglutamate synthase-like GNAT family acetyltransferase